MVQVVIKAANGKVSDFTVSNAEPRWTVAELKNYLYRHYPTHPPVPSQKLIYSGQMLQNTQQLTDILTSGDEDRDRVIVHLVAYERSVSAPTVQTSVPHAGTASPGGVAEEGEEEGDHVEDSAGTSSTDEDRESTAAAPPNHTPHSWLRYRPHPQHMQQLQNFPMFPMGGGYPYPPFYMPPYAAGNHADLQQWYNAYYARPGAMSGEVGGGEGDDIDLPNLPDQPDNQDVDQDDLPMNAGAGGMMLGGPQLQARRDLVDYGYMLLMATVLVSVAYFTSSFGRIILFLGGVMFMFMNQAGWFSLQRRPRNAANEDDDLPNPLDRHQAARQQQEPQQPQQGEAAGPRATEGTDEGTEPPVADSAPTIQPPPPPPRPGVLTVVFTFVTTLFTSLLPQQQPEL